MQSEAHPLRSRFNLLGIEVIRSRAHALILFRRHFVKQGALCRIGHIEKIYALLENQYEAYS